MGDFEYGISTWAPFRGTKAAKDATAVTQEELCNHSNPDLCIEVVDDDEFVFRRVWDIFERIKLSAERKKRLVLILPQPHPQYRKVAYLINKFKIDCRNLYTFNMDEWADEDGNIAPENWPKSFMYAQMHNFYSRIDEDLRPPRKHIQGPTNKNIGAYGRMIEDLGGADVCYGGIGWSGHIAFIEPRAPEFEGDLDDWKQMGPRIVTLSPFTIAQSCLDPEFGMSGAWSMVPPKAATIGPAEVISAKLRSSWNGFSVRKTAVSWQRYAVRLALHGPITPEVPASILQLGRSNVYISSTVAANIECATEYNWY